MSETLLEPFPVRVRRLIQEKREEGYETSQERIATAAWDMDRKGTSPSMFKQVMSGRRAVTPALIEAVARALHVPADTFIEYQLALARRVFDERELGLEAAYANFTMLEEALQGVALPDPGTASAPGASSRSQPSSTDRAPEEADPNPARARG